MWSDSHSTEGWQLIHYLCNRFVGAVGRLGEWWGTVHILQNQSLLRYTDITYLSLLNQWKRIICMQFPSCTFFFPYYPIHSSRAPYSTSSSSHYLRLITPHPPITRHREARSSPHIIWWPSARLSHASQKAPRLDVYLSSPLSNSFKDAKHISDRRRYNYHRCRWAVKWSGEMGGNIIEVD